MKPLQYATLAVAATLYSISTIIAYSPSPSELERIVATTKIVRPTPTIASPYNGDGFCDPGEYAFSKDCTPLPTPFCGDGLFDPGEIFSCPEEVRIYH